MPLNSTALNVGPLNALVVSGPPPYVPGVLVTLPYISVEDNPNMYAGTLLNPALPDVSIPISMIEGLMPANYYEEYTVTTPDVITAGSKIIEYSQEIDSTLLITLNGVQLYNARLSRIIPENSVDVKTISVKCSKLFDDSERPPYVKKRYHLTHVIKFKTDVFGRTAFTCIFNPEFRRYDEVIHEGAIGFIIEGEVVIKPTSREMTLLIVWL